MLAVLDDRWSAYYAPRDYSAFGSALQGRYTGVGLWSPGHRRRGHRGQRHPVHLLPTGA